MFQHPVKTDLTRMEALAGETTLFKHENQEPQAWSLAPSTVLSMNEAFIVCLLNWTHARINMTVTGLQGT